MHILEKYKQRIATANSLLCVGLDSRIDRLPERFLQAEHPQFDFNRWIIEETHHVALAYKPNLAFYESVEGYRSLQLTLDYLRGYHPDIVTIADAKRADIGSTNEGYVQSIFDELGFDAITLNPYLGREALEPFLEREDKGCIILCRTSNPGAERIQELNVDGKALWQHIAYEVATTWNSAQNCMLVIGATHPQALAQVRQLVGDMLLLVPGIGAQGGDLAQTLQAGLNVQGHGLIINASRSIIFSESPRQTAQELFNAINRHR